MQGDVSIGNVLMTTNAVERKAFEIPEEFLAHLSSLEDKSLVAEILALCKRVEQLVAELGISDRCMGFIADGDLAMTWEDCSSEENRWNKWVSRFRIGCKTVFDAPRRVRLNSCLGGSRTSQQ